MKPGDKIVILAGSRVRRVKEKEMLDLGLQGGMIAHHDIQGKIVSAVEQPNGVVYDFEYEGEPMRGWSYKFEVRW